MSRVLALLLLGLAAVAAAGCAGGSAASNPPSTSSAAHGPRWRFAAPMVQRRSYMAAAQIGDHVYVAGGMFGPTGVALGLPTVGAPEPLPAVDGCSL